MNTLIIIGLTGCQKIVHACYLRLIRVHTVCREREFILCSYCTHKNCGVSSEAAIEAV